MLRQTCLAAVWALQDLGRRGRPGRSHSWSLVPCDPKALEALTVLLELHQAVAPQASTPITGTTREQADFYMGLIALLPYTKHRIVGGKVQYVIRRHGWRLSR